jgi:hypothetical protein
MNMAGVKVIKTLKADRANGQCGCCHVRARIITGSVPQ